MAFSRFVFVFLFAALCYGCSGVKLGPDHQLDADDWITEGASLKRQHATSMAIDPPLFEQWRYDVGAGVGPAGALIVDNAVIVGTRNGLLHSINIADGDRLSRVKLDAPIEGGMAIGDDRLFLPMAGDKKSVIAYDLTSGKKSWTLKGKPVEAGLVYTSGKVIAVNAEAHVLALESRTGEEIWNTQIAERATVVSSPLVLDDRLFVLDESGTLFALRLEDGEILWQKSLGSPVYNTASTNGELIFVPTTRGRLFALDSDRGDVVWQYALSDSTVRFTTPAYAAQEDKIVFSATNGEVRALDALTGDEEWVSKLDGAISSAPLITAHTVYVGTMRKYLHALDFKTGIELWSHELTGRIKSAVVGANDRIIVMAETQKVFSFSSEDPSLVDVEEGNTSDSP